MNKKYDSTAIEKKWQQKWEVSKLYEVGERDTAKEKEYILVEWPYPSGNLHIGHWYAFAVPDIYARYRKMNGVQVLFPIGFDAFGLPAENAAIKRKLNPRDWTYDNIDFMKGQLASMGNMFAWDKTANSTDPSYYKWTQWMFTKFFENDIAYRGKGVVNWCPSCNTVIANEQVLSDDTCERCATKIEKREMPQWMLRITKYADRLIEDLDTVDWPEHIKEAQRQWIGRSKGAEINFVLSTEQTVTVFTTRPDTLYGATYLVLAPEHPLLQNSEVRGKASNLEVIDAYIEQAKQMNEQDRLDATKEKTGVKIEGVTATNPANGQEIPLFVADYVLGGYGTGAIMAVPAHDERDYEFATTHNVPITGVIDNVDQKEQLFPYTGNGRLKNSGEFDGMDNEEAKTKIVEKVHGRLTSMYRLRDWSIGRQRYWGVPIPIVYDPSGNAHPIPEEYLPWVLPNDVDPTPTGIAPLAKSQELMQRTVDIFGEGWTPEVETMDTFVDSSWYFLRYLDNTNTYSIASLDTQREWMPIDIYFGGAEHTTMHLLYSRFWQKALFDLQLVTESEPYRRRVNRGLILGPDGNKMSKSKGNVIDPDEQVRYVGADTVKMYLAFMGPYEGNNYPWDMGGIVGIRRFLERIYGLSESLSDTESHEMTKLLHKTVKKVGQDILHYKFNTAISAMMIFVNEAEKKGVTRETYTTFVRILAPFAPHLSEEIWHELGNSYSVHSEHFPSYNEEMTIDDTVEIGVQINGKMRGSITIHTNATEDEVLDIARKNNKIADKIAEIIIERIIYVPGRILNIIGKDASS
jgi:leucyl-tRNA synthetase